MLVFSGDIIVEGSRSLDPFCQHIYRVEFAWPAERAAPALSQRGCYGVGVSLYDACAKYRSWKMRRH
jgi:hypothetical protein